MLDAKMVSGFRKIIHICLPRPVLNGLRRLYSSIKKSLDSHRYSGNKVICLVCGAPHQSFAPFGSLGQGLRCVKCNSLGRHRLIWHFMERETKLIDAQKKKVLHVAPEECFYKKISKIESIEYFPCDIEPKNFFFRGPSVLRQDLTSLDFDDNVFDTILCNHVLEHIPKDIQAMRELHRVMKVGGWGIFQVPIDESRLVTFEDPEITTPQGRKAAFGQEDHVRWYGLDYKARLESVGFDVTLDGFVHTFTDKEKERYGFPKQEEIYFCKKVRDQCLI